MRGGGIRCARKLASVLFILVWQSEGLKEFSTITVNRVDSVRLKHLRQFYLTPLCGCRY